jgi:chemotaxis family two-component system sensor kinase Cph1
MNLSDLVNRDIASAQGIDEREIASRKAFLGIDERDEQALKALHEALQGDYGDFVDGFYAHLRAFEETRNFLQDASLVERLKQKQTDYFARLTAGDYGLDYVLNRLQVGVTHQRIGLQPKWYVGAHGRYLAWLLPRIADYLGNDTRQCLATCLALFKIILLDIELAGEAYFHREHEMLRLLAKSFENNVEGIVITDQRGKILHANKGVGAVLGYAPAEITGKNLASLQPEEHREQYGEIRRKVIEAGQWQGETWQRRKSGELFPAWTNISVVHDENREISHFVVEFSDITEFRRAQETLAQRTDELARSNKELEQFAYVASHDLQEPLRMVASYTQLLARRYKGKLDADADEFIGYAVDGATRMQTLINDLLKFSRVGTKGKPFAPLDCNVALERAKANLRLAIEESGAVVTHDPLPTLLGDDLQWVQLLQNLLGNAIKFRGDQPPRVHVSAAAADGEWVFEVKDDGIGIAPEFAERIFIIFQRLHTKEQYPGTGIGLAICKKIVERHGGRITVESQPGQGATFRFTIPIRGEQQS